MTTLPAPVGYVNRGKGCFRRLSDDEKRFLAGECDKHGMTKTSEKYQVSIDYLSGLCEKFPFKKRPPYRPFTYTDEDVAAWAKRVKANEKSGMTNREAVNEAARFFAVDYTTILNRVFGYKKPR